MENYYEVTKQSNLYQEYMDYISNNKEMRKIADEFLIKNEVDTDKYAGTADTFYIIPTEKDLNEFEKFLCKPLENWLRAFKKTSKIGKAWLETLEENNIKPMHKPFLQEYFNVWGQTWNRLFNVGDKVYCSFKSEYDFKNPEGFEELKLSEFFKIVEDENERRKQLHESN